MTKNLCYMGVTEKTNDFEHKVPQVARKLVNGECVDDVVDEDTSSPSP